MDKLKENLAKFGRFVKTKTLSMNKKLRIGIIAGLVVIVASIVTLSFILGQTGYTVLYSGASNTEAAEILSYARETLGATDIQLNANGDILVPDDQVERLRMELSIAGYPKSTFNYDIVNNVSMFTTDSQFTELQTQQLQENLRATLCTFQGVDACYVILSIPKERSYVLDSSKEPSSAAITVTLREELTAEQIDGMYNLVKNSVPGLLRENITITDSTGRQLYAIYDENEDDEETARLQLYYQRLDFERQIAEDMKIELEEMFADKYEGVKVGVGLDLNYDNQVEESTIYSGTNVDEDGNQSGIISDEHYENAAGGVAADGGLVGTTVDADISPDYPTLTVGEDGEFYYQSAREINYKVNETKRQIEKNGYTIDKLSASVLVNSTETFSNDEQLQWRTLIANAIGADVANVSFIASPFIQETGSGLDADSISVTTVSNQSMLLLVIIIALGVILIILLILALTATGSKKRRSGSAKLSAAAASANANAASALRDSEESGNAPRTTVITEDPEMFDVQSLSADDVPETRDAVLKREIREFSKTNPEIVAQLIRTWVRSDE